MAGTTPLSDEQSVIDIIGPSSYAQTNGISTLFLPLNADRRIQFVTSIGSIFGGTNALTFQVVQATDTNGASVKPIDDLVVSGYTNQVRTTFVFDVRGADLDTNNGFATCALVVTPSTSAGFVLYIVSLGDPEVTPPVSAADEVLSVN